MQQLHAAGSVGIALSELLTGWAESLQREISSYTRSSPYDQELLRPRIVASFMDLESAIDAVKFNRRIVDVTAGEVLTESLRKVVPGPIKIETLVVVSDVGHASLYSAIKLTASELGFILYLSAIADYTSYPLPPRIIHEAAHARSEIALMVENPKIREKHFGEVMCDCVALAVGGPAFLKSTEALITQVGTLAARRATYSHPSMAARSSIQESISNKIWASLEIRELVKEIFDAIRDLKCQPNEVPDQEYHRARALSNLSGYLQLGPTEDVWREIYAKGNYNRQDSILVRMNIDFARRRAVS